MENKFQKKIPLLNDTFDLNAFFYILRSNVLLFILLFFIAVGGAFIYLRYTSAIYASSSILQINQEETTTSSILEIENVYGNTSLDNLIEQLRSREFLKRILKKLPLNVAYYNEGTFKAEELYKRSPFFVEVKKLSPALINVPIYIEFISEEQFTLSYIINDNQIEHTFSTNTWNTLSGECEIYVNISNYLNIKEHSNNLKRNKYFFRFFDEITALNYHMAELQISILSQKANTIQVTYTGENAQKTSDIVNAITEEFLNFNLEKKQKRAQKILDFIEQQLRIVYQELDETERKIKKFRKQHNIDNDILSSNIKKTGNKIKENEILNELDEMDRQFENFENITAQLQTSQNINTAELATLLSDTKSESMILNFLNAIQQLQTEKEELLINVTENNRRIKAIDKQIKNQKTLLSDFIRLTNENLKKEREMLRQKITQGDSDSTTTIAFDEIEYAKLLRLYNVHQEFYNELLSKKAQYLISKAGNVSQNLILEKSQIPDTPISPQKTKIVILTFLLWSLLISFITIIKYLLHNEITTANDVTKYTDVPITGVIPLSKKAKENKRFLVENKPNSIFTESFRILRSNLDFIASSEGSKILTITSTISGEGKTFVAINLGGVYAFSGKKVVLIDMDLRRPKVHLSFNTDNEKGMSTLLIKRDCIPDCIKSTDLENFDFIPAGPIPPNPAELANSKTYDVILQQLKEKYDIVIIDTPPIGIVSDAIYSYKKSDYPLYVTKANYSKRNFIHNLNHLKEQKNIKNISIVLNGIHLQVTKYGYGNYSYGQNGYYGYGYGYGYGYYTSDEDIKSRFSILNSIKKVFTNK